MLRIPRYCLAVVAVSVLGGAPTGSDKELQERAERYLTDLIRLDTSNPPGNETRVAEYLQRVANAEGIGCELLGPEPNRLNFIARLKGSGKLKPLLLMAHSDVVPADRSHWTVDPFAAVVSNGVLYGRGTEDVKSLLAAELSVLVELKRRAVRLDRDVILLAESDEEAGSTGMTWLIQNAWPKIDAEFALNELGYWQDEASGERLFQIQTSEKVPTRMRMTVRGSAGHGSRPRSDNAVVHLARALTRLAEADQPVALNTTTRRYFAELAKLPGRRWIAPLLPRLEDPNASTAASTAMREHDPELDGMLHTTVSPTMLEAGVKINVIPNSATGLMDVRRLPGETEAEIYARFRRIIDDPAVALEPAGGQSMPATEPSSLTSPLYQAMEKVLRASHPRAQVVPFMMLGATDGAYLRAKGVAVYGVPVFGREGEPRMHGNDERISLRNFRDGTGLLFNIVSEVAVAKGE